MMLMLMTTIREECVFKMSVNVLLKSMTCFVGFSSVMWHI